jgi:hypothetical protein
MGDLRELIVKILGDDSDLSKKLGKAGGDVEKFGKDATKAGSILTAGLTLPIIGMGVFAVKAAMDAQSHLAQTEAVIKSTGGSAGVTSQHVQDLAGKIMQLSGADDDTVQAGENMLLTFTNIKAQGGIFDRATAAAVNLATALNDGVVPSAEQVQAQAMQIGKALNDPISGMTKLQRIGVTFSDDQVKLVKRLQDSGDMMGAQKVILDELGKEFGGSAASAGQTFAGKMSLLQNTLGNLGETVGGVLLPALTNLATQATPYITQLADAISHLSPTMLLVIGGALALAAGIGPLLVIVGSLIGAVSAILPVFAAVAGFLAGPLLLPVLGVIAGIAALVAAAIAIGIAFKKVYDGSKPLQQALGYLGDTLKFAVAAPFADLQYIIEQIMPYLGMLAGYFGDKLTSAATALAPVLTQAAGVLADLGVQFANVMASGGDSFVAFFIGQVVPAAQQVGQVIDGVILPALLAFGAWVGANILPVLGSSLQSIGAVLASQVGPLLQQVGDVVQNNVMPALAGLMATFETMKPALAVIGIIIGTIVVVALGLLMGALQGLMGALGPLLGMIVGVFGGALQFISGVIQLIIGIFQLLIAVVVGIFTGDWSGMQGALNTLKQAALNILGGLWGMISSVFTGGINVVKGLITGFISGVVGFFTNLYNTIVGHSLIPDLVNGIISWIAQLPGRVGAFILQLITTGIALFENLRAMAISKVMALVVMAEATAARLKDALTAPIHAAEGIIGGILSNLAGMFAGLHLTLPHINLPHFHISGSFSLNPPSIPSIGVDWYARGGIFTGPSVIGVGEDGPEAVVPLKHLDDYAGGGSSSSAPGMTEISLDGRVIVRALLPYIVDELRRSGAIRNI